MIKQENIHFFTFGLGHELAGHCQPIIADNPELARQVMVDRHGNKWAFQYTFEEYTKNRKEGFSNEALLETIKVTATKAR